MQSARQLEWGNEERVGKRVSERDVPFPSASAFCHILLHAAMSHVANTSACVVGSCEKLVCAICSHDDKCFESVGKSGNKFMGPQVLFPFRHLQFLFSRMRELAQVFTFAVNWTGFSSHRLHLVVSLFWTFYARGPWQAGNEKDKDSQHAGAIWNIHNVIWLASHTLIFLMFVCDLEWKLGLDEENGLGKCPSQER